MALFEAFYGRWCRTPLCWSQVGERAIFGLHLVIEAEEKVRVIQANLKAAQSRQKELLRQEEKALAIPSRWSCLSSSLAYQGCVEIRSEGQISSPLRWSLWNYRNLWTRGLHGATSSTAIHHPRHLPCFSAQEVCSSSHRNHPTTRHTHRTRPLLPGTSYQDPWSDGMGYQKEGG